MGEKKKKAKGMTAKATRVNEGWKSGKSKLFREIIG